MCYEINGINIGILEDYSLITYLSMFCDDIQSIQKIFSQSFDIIQVILHGIRKIHKVIEINWISLNSLKRNSECGRKAWKQRSEFTLTVAKLHSYQTATKRDDRYWKKKYQAQYIYLFSPDNEIGAQMYHSSFTHTPRHYIT